jgi:hypothetical protein
MYAQAAILIVIHLFVFGDLFGGGSFEKSFIRFTDPNDWKFTR